MLAAKLSIAVIALGAQGLAAARTDLRLQWSELPPVVSGQNIEMVLPDATRVKGKVMAITEDELRMRITATSKSQAWPKGDASIPRAAVSVIRIVKRSKTWRAVLTPAVPAGLLGVMALATSAVQPAPAPQEVIPVGMAVTLGSTIAAYYVGKKLDLLEDTRITVIPDHRSAVLLPVQSAGLASAPSREGNGR